MKKLLIMFVAAALGFYGCSDDKTEESSRDAISITPDKTPVIGLEGGVAEVTVTSTGDWRLAGVSDWAHPSAVSGTDGQQVTFTVDPNETGEDREAEFKFFTGSAVAPLKIVSSAGNVLALVSNPNVAVNRDETEVRIELDTNISDLTYTFTQGGDKWVAFQGRTDVFGKTLLSFLVAENPDYDDRQTELTIAGLGKTVKVQILQKQLNDIITKDHKFTFDMAERTFSIDVEANVEYTVSCLNEWITRVETRGLTTEKFQFRLEAATASRVGKIAITCAQFPELSQIITVIQRDPEAQPVTIPDKAFRNYLVQLGWLLELGDEYLLSSDGTSATSFQYNPSYYDDPIESLEGIGFFPELESIDVYDNALSRIDISMLKKVTSLKVDANGLSEIILGDNAVEQLSFDELYHEVPGSWYDYVMPKTLTVSGTKLKVLEVPYSGNFWDPDDELRTIDVSGCPALESLYAVRAEGVLTTIYLKQGQTVANMAYTEGAQIVYK